jgi:hypothetical protein
LWAIPDPFDSGPRERKYPIFGHFWHTTAQAEPGGVEVSITVSVFGCFNDGSLMINKFQNISEKFVDRAFLTPVSELVIESIFTGPMKYQYNIK